MRRILLIAAFLSLMTSPSHAWNDDAQDCFERRLDVDPPGQNRFETQLDRGGTVGADQRARHEVLGPRAPRIGSATDA